MYDLVVLGGGAGGLSVATAAARVGAKVALVETHKLGGECTHFACVPSKALLRAAAVAHEARQAPEVGVRVGAVEVDFAAVMARVRAVVAEFAGEGSGDSLRAKGIEVFHGSPAFEAYDTVVVGGETRLQARRFVIATGSRPAVPDIPGLAEAGYLQNETIWDLNERPASLVVIGGGPVGMEFAQAFARLGSRVVVLNDAAHVLPHEDPEVAEALQSALEAEGVTIHNNVEVTRVSARDGNKVVSYRQKAGGKTGELAGSHLLVAAGRRANVEGLNLDAVGIHADAVDGIDVDDYLQTRTQHIFAIGDVLARDQYTHAAEREAEIAFENAVLRPSSLGKRMDYDAMPRVVFTDPEVASVGVLDAGDLPPGQAGETVTVRASFADVDRARIDGRTTGFAKVLATPSGRILGAAVVGPEAAAVLQEFVLAMQHGLKLADIAATVHPYPTYSAIARKLANEFVTARGEGGFVRTALRWFFGYPSRGGEPVSEVAGHDEAAANAEPAGRAAGH